MLTDTLSSELNTSLTFCIWTCPRAGTSGKRSGQLGFSHQWRLSPMASVPAVSWHYAVSSDCSTGPSGSNVMAVCGPFMEDKTEIYSI